VALALVVSLRPFLKGRWCKHALPQHKVTVGYQSSVIGPRAKYMRLRWRCGEVRFETRFTTPDIRLLSHYESVYLKDMRSRCNWTRFKPENWVKYEQLRSSPCREILLQL